MARAIMDECWDGSIPGNRSSPVSLLRHQQVRIPREGAPVARSGHTLTILRKEKGKWLLARDANLLVTEKGDR
ncbi:MAG: hypothetical protein EOP87_21455 [Verrucomicrobiaceae bacterium]|nr:MAG: hypothetical protein EOP87_21455 [Verrucomicrobiaceae bacterium]